MNVVCDYNLDFLANLAAIFTALIAAFGYGAFRYEQYKKQCALVKYLKSEKDRGIDMGQRSILHLMARLGLTESEILHSSFKSKNIARLVASDPNTNRAEDMLFEYKD